MKTTIKPASFEEKVNTQLNQITALLMELNTTLNFFLSSLEVNSDAAEGPDDEEESEGWI